MWNEYPNLILQIGDLRREAGRTYEQLVVQLHATEGFAQSLYGYMHRVFAFIDTLSAYWRGTDANQSPRMVDFMVEYFGPNRRAYSVAIQIWRHKLVHTALPRNLIAGTNGQTMHYLLQWHASQMTPSQPHGTIVSFGSDGEVLNLSCISLIEELEAAAAKFVAELESSPRIQANAAKFAHELANYKLRAI